MYGQQQPQYGAPPPQQQWGAPPPPGGPGGYGQPQYGAPPGPPPNQYGTPQQHYGAPAGPPPGQHGAPQQQWGAPAPPSGYGASQQQYGQFPPPSGPPPPQQYGAPPPNAYGAPPQQQYGALQSYGAPQTGYGAPPSGAPGMSGGPRFLGVLIPPPPPAVPTTNLPGYNAQFDAERIRKATKGFGTDERVLIDTLAPLDAFQIDVLSRTFEQTTGKSLKKTLEKELSSWLEYVLVLKSLGPLGGDLHLLHRACSGIGTHEDILNEILLGRTNEEIFLLKEGYKREYGKDLVKVIQGELSMKTERLFNMALSGSRDESTFVNQQQVQQDVEALYRAGAGKIGTDEIAICGIMLSRSDAHLQAIAQAFPQRHRVSLSQMILSEFSGHMQDGLYYIARAAEMDGRGIVRDTEVLESSMEGLGTKDERLCYRLVRLSWNKPRFAAVKNQYQATYKTSLRRRVEGETTGKYEKALVAIIDQN